MSKENPSNFNSKYSLLRKENEISTFGVNQISMRKLITILICITIVTSNSLVSNATADSVQYWTKKSVSNKDSLSALYNFKLGNWYARGGSKFDSALICMKKSLAYYSQIKDKEKIGDCNYRMGIAYARMKNNKKALSKFKTAENYFKEIKDTSKRIFAMEAQGFAFNPDQRIDLYTKTLTLARSANLIDNEITILGNLARAYSNKGISDSTISLLNKQYKILKNKESREGENNETNTRLVYCVQSLGHAYYKKSNWSRSFKYYNEAYKLSKKIDPNFSAIASVTAHINFINYYWKKDDPIGHRKAYKDINVLSLLREGQRVAQRSQSLNMQIRMAESMTYYYSNNNNGDSAMRYQEVLLLLKDSANRTEQVKASAKFAEELKTADKEKEIIKLNADKKIASTAANRNKIIFILILLGLLSSIFFIVKRIKYKNQKEQEERDKTFRSKLSSDLHDDVGTILTSLSMQSELLQLKISDENKKTAKKIADMSRDATSRMRDTVWAIDSRKDNVMDLTYRMIDFATDMLESKGVEFQLEHNIAGKEDKLSAEVRQTIFVIFKEVITNAAKYGSGELVSATLKKEKDFLKLNVQNELEGSIDLEKTSGLGLSNIKERTEAINGTATFNNDQDRFSVALSIHI